LNDTSSDKPPHGVFVKAGMVSDVVGRWLCTWEVEEPSVTAALWASEYQGRRDLFLVRSIEATNDPPAFDAVVVNARTGERFRMTFNGFFAPTSLPTWDMIAID
jgi:hypothetical protein